MKFLSCDSYCSMLDQLESGYLMCIRVAEMEAHQFSDNKSSV